MSSSYDSSEEEFDMEEEEDLAMILAMHINKKNRSTVVRLWVGRKFGGIGSMPTTD